MDNIKSIEVSDQFRIKNLVDNVVIGKIPHEFTKTHLEINSTSKKPILYRIPLTILSEVDKNRIISTVS